MEKAYCQQHHTRSALRPSCWTRFWWEMRQSYPFFSLDELERIELLETKEQDGMHVSTEQQQQQQQQTWVLAQIGVKACFAPDRPCFLTAWIRLFWVTWAVQVLYSDLVFYPPHNLYIYMGYLTHWGLILSILYLCCSFWITICPGALIQPPENSPPSRLVRLTWGLYSTVAPLELAITLLYWTAIASEPIRYVSVMEHGGIAAMVLLDGAVVGLVPIRAKHFIFLMLVCILYCLWSIVDAVLDIGNGEWGPAYNDDALYPVLNWNSQRQLATIVSAFAICVLAPGLFVACYLLSLRQRSPPTVKQTLVLCEKHGSRGFCCCSYGPFDGSSRPLYNANDESKASGKQQELKTFDYNAMGEVL